MYKHLIFTLISIQSTTFFFSFFSSFSILKLNSKVVILCYSHINIILFTLFIHNLFNTNYNGYRQRKPQFLFIYLFYYYFFAFFVSSLSRNATLSTKPLSLHSTIHPFIISIFNIIVNTTILQN